MREQRSEQESRATDVPKNVYCVLDSLDVPQDIRRRPASVISERHGEADFRKPAAKLLLLTQLMTVFLDDPTMSKWHPWA